MEFQSFKIIQDFQKVYMRRFFFFFFFFFFFWLVYFDLSMACQIINFELIRSALNSGVNSMIMFLKCQLGS